MHSSLIGGWIGKAPFTLGENTDKMRQDVPKIQKILIADSRHGWKCWTETQCGIIKRRIMSGRSDISTQGNSRVSSALVFIIPVSLD